MGWTYRTKDDGQSVADVLDELCTFESGGYRSRLLDCAVVSLFTAYAAVERITIATGEKEVYALVCLLDHVPGERHNFGYKDMDETMGPYEDQCPERILKLLTPTENPCALRWRKKCWERIERRKKYAPLKSGNYLVLDRPIEFADGQKRHVFYIKDARRRIFLASPNGYLRYKLPASAKLAETGYQVVERHPDEKPSPKSPTAPEAGSLLFNFGKP